MLGVSVSSASSATARLPNDIICLNTHSKRSVEHRLIPCSDSRSPCAFDKFRTHGSYPGAEGSGGLHVLAPNSENQNGYSGQR